MLIDWLMVCPLIRVQYIKSFVVVGDDQAQKTEYIRKYLADAEVCLLCTMLQ